MLLGEDYRIAFVLPKLPKLPVYLLIEGQCVMAAVTTKSGDEYNKIGGHNFYRFINDSNLFIFFVLVIQKDAVFLVGKKFF